jgi:hypothetical protein
MKKIIFLLLIIVFTFWNALAAYEKKWFESYDNAVPESQIIDSLYFPWWNLWISSSKSAWPRTPYVFNSWASYRLYNYLYFWTEKFWLEKHELLFEAINNKFKKQFEFKYKSPSSDKKIIEERNKVLNKLDVEIKVAKFRYQNNPEANKDEKDITTKLEKIYEIMWDAYWKTWAWLQIEEDENNKICWKDISLDFNFKTVYLNNKDIKKYYLFGLPYSSYYNWDNDKYSFYYWSAWDETNKSKSFVIETEKDLKNINKQKFFLKQVFPHFKKVEYKEIYSNDNNNVYIPKWWAVLVQNKNYERVISTNNEAFFSLKQKDYIDYFKKNFNLYRFQDEYTFWPNLWNKRIYTFLLLWIDNKWNVRILTTRNIQKTLSLSKKLDLDFINKCNKFYLENKYDIYNSKILAIKKQKIENIFKKLDKKYKLDEFRKFKNNLYNQDVAIDEEQEIKKFLDKNIQIKKYKWLINKLSEKLKSIKFKLDTDIYTFLQKDIDEILKNKNKLAKKYYIKKIVDFIETEVNIRMRELSLK